MPKYIHIRGGQHALYQAQTLEFYDTVVFCEGELDAILLYQEAQEIAAAVTLGSASNPLNIPTWGWCLLGVQRLFTAYDRDKAGMEGHLKLDWLSPIRLPIPQLRPQDKDLTDFHKSGGNLLKWLQDSLNTP
jgi:hypothetical protein